MRISARGFTLIELLIVIAIIGILTAIAIPSFSSFNTNQRLSQAAKQVKNDLRSAQNRAINSVEGNAWGINIAPDATYYTMFKCPTTATYTLTNCSSVAQKNLSSGFTIRNPGFSDLVFDVVSGNVYVGGSLQTSGNFTFEVGSTTTQRTITVSAGGKIEEE